MATHTLDSMDLLFAEMSEYEKSGYHPEYFLSLARWCLWNEPELAEELQRGREWASNCPDYDSPEVEQQMMADYKRICDVSRSRRDQYDQEWIMANAHLN